MFRKQLEDHLAALPKPEKDTSVRIIRLFT